MLDQELIKSVHDFEGAVEAQVLRIAGEKVRGALPALVADTVS
jgi:hypothetical protein